jgi:hypothetical protein
MAPTGHQQHKVDSAQSTICPSCRKNPALFPPHSRGRPHILLHGSPVGSKTDQPSTEVHTIYAGTLIAMDTLHSSRTKQSDSPAWKPPYYYTPPTPPPNPSCWSLTMTFFFSLSTNASKTILPHASNYGSEMPRSPSSPQVSKKPPPKLTNELLGALLASSLIHTPGPLNGLLVHPHRDNPLALPFAIPPKR